MIRIGRTSRRTKIRYRIGDLTKEYLMYSQANKAANTCRIIREAFRDFLHFTQDVLLVQVRLETIEQFKAWRLTLVKPVTFNIGFRALKAGFEYAVRLGWLQENPFRLSKSVPVPEPDYPMYLTVDEIAQLLSVITDDEFRRLVRFYLYTGCRPTEAALLDWQDIDLKARVIIIRSRSTKTKKNRIIHIGTKLHQLLQEQSPMTSGRVFPRWKPCSISHIFKRYVRRCNFGRKITVHSLRHTATVHWLLAGVDLVTVSKILGHTSVKVTEQVYAHIPAYHKLDMMDKLPY